MAPEARALAGDPRARLGRLRPDSAALRRAVRVSLAGSPGFLVGVVVADDLQLGLFAMIGPVCLGSIAQLQGTPRRQLRDTLSAGVAAAVLVVLGTLVSDTTAAAAALTFGVAFAASFAAVAGRRVVSVATALTLLFVVASSVPAPDAAVGPRLEGLAWGLAGLALLLVLVPDRAQHAFRAALSDALGGLAALARAIAEDAPSAKGAAAAVRQARAVTLRAHPYLADAPQRPVGAGLVERAERLLVDDADRLAEDLATLQASVERPAIPLHPAALELTGAVAASLAASAAALSGGGAGSTVDGGAGLEGQTDAYVADVRARLAQDLRDGMEAEVLGRRSRRAVLLAVLGRTATAVAGHTCIALGEAVDRAVPGFADSSSSAAWLRRLRANLTPSSVLLRTSLRIGLGLAAARALEGVLDLQHGFWVVFATLSVLRTTPGRTGASALQAVAGTVLGALVATAIVLTLRADATAYAVLLPFAVFAGVAAAGIGVIAGQAAFTVMIVVLFNLAKPGAWELPLLRLEDVAIGAATGIAIGLATWPHGARAQVRRALAELVRTAAALATDVARAALTGGRTPAAAAGDSVIAEPQTLAADGEAAALATLRADDVFTTFLAETRDRERALDLWAGLLAGSHALRGLSTLLPPGTVAAPPEGAPVELADALVRSADGLAAHGARAADALGAGAAPAPALRASEANGAASEPGTRAAARRSVAAAHHDRGDAATARAVVDLFLLSGWIERANDELRRIDGLVALAARGRGGDSAATRG